MKTWHWVALGVVTLGVIYLFVRKSTTQTTGYVNPTTSAAASLGTGIGALLTSVFSGSKVSPPAGGAPPVGDSTTFNTTGSAWDKYTGASGSSASDPLGVGTLNAPDFSGQASGGTDIGGGLTAAQPTGNAFGIPALTAPSFSIGSNGADFAAN